MKQLLSTWLVALGIVLGVIAAATVPVAPAQSGGFEAVP